MNTIDIKKIEKAVIDWFQENEESRGIILPDGWFGRPYDYLLTLVEISSSDDVLNISLSDDFSFRAYPRTPAELRVDHAKEKWRKAR
jgi:hypothetical protein